MRRPLAQAATPQSQKWSFAGPFGKFDRGELQRGYKVYKEVCATCHSMNQLHFRNLADTGGPGFTAAQALAVAAEYQVKDGPNDAGDMFERPGRLADKFPAPFPNENAAPRGQWRRLSAGPVADRQGPWL